MYKPWGINVRTISTSRCLLTKSNDEGQDFYFLGKLQTVENSFVQEYMPMENKKPSPVVKMRFQIDPPIEDSLYYYLIDLK